MFGDSLTISPVENGKKSVTIYDSRIDCNQTIIVPTEKADEFVSSRQKILEMNGKKELIGIGISSATCGALGTALGFAFGEKNMKGMFAAYNGLFGLFAGAGIALAITFLRALNQVNKAKKLGEQFIDENK